MTLRGNPDSYALLSSVSDKGSSEGPLECSVHGAASQSSVVGRSVLQTLDGRTVSGPSGQKRGVLNSRLEKGASRGRSQSVQDAPPKIGMPTNA